MLESMRNAANSWLAKLLLGLVAISFISWGAQRRTLNFGSAPSLASVGGVEITDQQFARAFDRQLDQISRQAQRRITKEEARLYGLDRQVLNKLVGETAIDTHAAALGLALSDETIAQQLQDEPRFKDINGKFDKSLFDRFLQEARLTERGFLALQRTDDIRGQLIGALLAGVVTPQPVVTAVHNWQQETRVIEYFAIDAMKAVTVPEADGAKLTEVYAGNLDQFKAPEYRKLRILLLSVDELAKQTPVTDAEIAAAFEETKDDYATPERRRIQIIRFNSKADAQTAKAALDSGTDFLALAEQRGLKLGDLDNGLVTKKQIRDRKLAAAAFAIERDKVSDVVDTDLAYAILRVPEIAAGKLATLDEVKDRIKAKLARNKVMADLQKLRDQADDLRNAAKSDADIAEIMKLKVVEVAATDANGMDPEGKPAVALQDAKALVAAGFAANDGVDREPVELGDGGYGWVSVVSTTPVRQKAYEEVEAQVKAFYEDGERRRLVNELAGKLVERLNKGEAIDAIASEAGGKAEKSPAIVRTTIPQGLTDAAIKQAFTLPEGRAGSAETPDRKSRTVLRVAEVKPAGPMTKEQSEKLTATLSREVQIDAIDAYINAVQSQLGVKINEAELRRVAGSDAGQ